MNAANTAGLVISLVVVAFLVAALVFPERF